MSRETDGKTRIAKIEDIREGVILRFVDSEGNSYPFSDMVVCNVRYGEKTMKTCLFDCVRPFAFAHLGGELHSVEHIRDLSAYNLSNERYHIVLNSKGEPYRMELDRLSLVR